MEIWSRILVLEGPKQTYQAVRKEIQWLAMSFKSCRDQALQPSAAMGVLMLHDTLGDLYKRRR